MIIQQLCFWLGCWTSRGWYNVKSLWWCHKLMIWDLLIDGKLFFYIICCVNDNGAESSLFIDNSIWCTVWEIWINSVCKPNLLGRSHVSCFDWFLERNISFSTARLFVVVIDEILYIEGCGKPNKTNATRMRLALRPSPSPFSWRRRRKTPRLSFSLFHRDGWIEQRYVAARKCT